MIHLQIISKQSVSRPDYLTQIFDTKFAPAFRGVFHLLLVDSSVDGLSITVVLENRRWQVQFVVARHVE